jgi:hypothetical protein
LFRRIADSRIDDYRLDTLMQPALRRLANRV